MKQVYYLVPEHVAQALRIYLGGRSFDDVEQLISAMGQCKVVEMDEPVDPPEGGGETDG